MATRLYVILLALITICFSLKPVTFPLVRMGVEQAHLKAPQRSYGVRGSGHTVPAGGSITWTPTGAYYAAVTVGTPPQTVYALLDSGSADFLVTTKKCKGCNKVKEIEYEPLDSQGVKFVTCTSPEISCKKCDENKRCEFYNQYVTCAPDPNQVCVMEGHIYTDKFGVVGTDLSTSVAFGAIETMNITFPGGEKGISAIWGLSYREITSFGEEPPFQALVKAGQLEDIFAMCLHQVGGKFTLGGIDESLYTGDIQYTNITSPHGVDHLFYGMETLGMKVGGVDLGLQSWIYNLHGGSLLDSGTYSLYVQDAIYKVIYNLMEKICDKTKLEGVCGIDFNDSLFGGKCFPLTQEQVNAYPDIQVDLQGASLTVRPSSYLLNFSTNSTSNYCLAIQNGGTNSQTIHGNVVMLDYYTIFNRKDNKIGFAKRSESC